MIYYGKTMSRFQTSEIAPNKGMDYWDVKFCCAPFSAPHAQRLFKEIKMKCEELIYLDSEFLSKKYEDENAEPVMTSLVRDEGLNAGIKIPFASGGAHTKEIRTYNISVYGMYKNLRKFLERYPKIQTIDETVHGKIGWATGRFFVAKHKITRRSGGKEEVFEDGLAFEIEIKNTNTVILVTKDEYFSSGCENLLNMLSPIYLSFESDVNCLLNIIGWNKVIKMAVGVPYLIQSIVNNSRIQK